VPTVVLRELLAIVCGLITTRAGVCLPSMARRAVAPVGCCWPRQRGHECPEKPPGLEALLPGTFALGMTGSSGVRRGVGEAARGAGGSRQALGEHIRGRAAGRHEARGRTRSVASRWHCLIRVRTGNTCMTTAMVKRLGLCGGPLLGLLCY